LKKFSNRPLGSGTINEVFQIDGIPLWWFLEPMIYSYLPSPIRSVAQMDAGISANAKSGGSPFSSLLLKSKIAVNEKLKALFADGTENNTGGSELMFFGYTNYATSDSDGKLQFVWFYNIVKVLCEKGHNPLVITCDPISRNSLFKLGRYENVIYRYIDSAIVRESRRISRELCEKWKNLIEDEKSQLFTLNGRCYYVFLKDDFDTIFSEAIIGLVAKYYLTFKKIIEDHRIEVAYLNALYGFYDVALLGACYKLNRKAVFSPHGYAGDIGCFDLDRKVTGNVLYENLYLMVQNEADRSALAKTSVKNENIFVTGLPLFDSVVDYRDRKRSSDKKTVAFLTNTSVEDKVMAKDEYFRYIRTYMSQIKNIGNLRLIVKMHPVERNKEEYVKILKSLGIDDFEVVQTSDKKTLYKILSESDIIVGFASTVMIEALMLGKTPIVIEGFFERLNNVAYKEATFRIQKNGNVADAITRLLTNADLQQEFKSARDEYLHEYFDNLDGGASFRIAMLLDRLLER
jgi:hypothetical protein